MTENAKKYRGWYIVGGVCAFLLLAGITLYERGYRLENNFRIGKLGTLSVTLPFKETSLFIDTNKKFVTTQENEELSIKLSPTTHLVIVSRAGYFPWAKKITIPSAQTHVIHPIFVTQNTTGQIITQNDAQYASIIKNIRANTVPTKDAPLISYDGLTKLWLESNTILIERNGEVHTVLLAQTPIKNLFFYKDRGDAVIFSTAESVFVIETETENTQNILPLYKGQDPYFIETDPNYIYVLDNNSLMSVII